MSRFRMFPALVLGLASLSAAPAAAQEISGVFDMSQLTGTFAMDAITLAEEKRSGTGRYANSQPRRAVRAAPIARSNLTYRSDAALRQKYFAQFVAKTRQSDPAGAAKLQQVLANENVIGKIQAGIAPYGMSTNNVADASAVYLAYAWMATRADDRDPTRAQMLGLRNQLAAAMATNSAFASASNAVKQEVAEANLIQGLMAGQLAALAKQDPAVRGKIRAAVARGAKATYGFDLLSLNLTDQGLRP
ncbi:hypothetical protein EWE75_23215 [Sphingomonas populi]|uniref:DUF1217 domain-containing protein n=1 Tax=Sphingomonas populi TaxID=2484750 RepID=A0A4Q6XGV3_9SPHN|nr:DUF6683 family protein [Sphingomonas populi]RZF59160.1 hypothetical protein EWE75_23215 [Sphingomonas populi]